MNTTKFIRVLVVTAMVLSMGRGAYAYFAYEPQEIAPAPQTEEDYAGTLDLNALPFQRLVQVGYGEAESVDSFGAAIPLGQALLMVLPNDHWRVLYDHDEVTDYTTPVSWERGKPWTQTLESMAVQSKTRMVLDWRKRHVLVMAEGDAPLSVLPDMPAEELVEPAPGMIGEVEDALDDVEHSLLDPAPVPAPVFPEEPPMPTALAPGNLLESLEGFLDAWGYTMEIGAIPEKGHFELSAPIQIAGSDFVADIETIMTALNQSPQFHVTVDVHRRNRVALINIKGK